MKIIAFGHEQRVGKNTAGCLTESYLRATHTRRYPSILRTGFASKLKAICYELYKFAGLMDEQYYEDYPEAKEIVLPDLKLTPRQIWINFGTKGVREQVYDKTWSDYLLKSLDNVDVLIITDLRFPDEAIAVQNAGGICIKIDRDVMKTHDVADSAGYNFKSWDHKIDNNGTRLHMAQQLKPILDGYMQHE